MAQQSWIDETVVWSFTTEASSGITLSVNALSQANTVDNVVVSVEFDLVSNNLSQSNTVDNVVVGSKYTLITNNLSQSNIVENIDLIQQSNLLVNELYQSNVINNIDLFQKNNLSVNNLSQTNALENISLSVSAVVDITAPTNTSQNVSLPITFAWDVFEGADCYKIIVSENSDLSSPIITEIVFTNSYTEPGILNGSTTYYWRVCAGFAVS